MFGDRFLKKTRLTVLARKSRNKMRIHIDENKCLGYNKIQYKGNV